jgi:hypothetical protein
MSEKSAVEILNQRIEKEKEELNARKSTYKTLADGKAFNEKAIAILERDHRRLAGKTEKALKKLNRELTKLMATRERFKRPYLEAIQKINDAEREVGWSERRIGRLERHLEVLKLQEQGWVIYSVDKGMRGIRLGDFRRNNYRPEGWSTTDIKALPNGIYVRTNLSGKYRKVENPGANNVTMVRGESLLRDGKNLRVTGHTEKKPKVIEAFY